MTTGPSRKLANFHGLLRRCHEDWTFDILSKWYIILVFFLMETHETIAAMLLHRVYYIYVSYSYCDMEFFL